MLIYLLTIFCSSVASAPTPGVIGLTYSGKPSPPPHVCWSLTYNGLSFVLLLKKSSPTSIVPVVMVLLRPSWNFSSKVLVSFGSPAGGYFIGSISGIYIPSSPVSAIAWPPVISIFPLVIPDNLSNQFMSLISFFVGSSSNLSDLSLTIQSPMAAPHFINFGIHSE